MALLLLALAGSVLLYWSWGGGQAEPAARSTAGPAAQAGRRPAYRIEGLEALSMDAEGRPAYRLSGASMEPLQETEGVEWFEVQLELLAEKPPWIVRAGRADIDEYSRIIRLYDQIEARQVREDGLLTCLWGRSLRIYPDTRYAESGHPIRLRQGEMELSAAGAQLDLRQGLIDLRGPVRGHYRPPRPAAPGARFEPCAVRIEPVPGA